MLPALRNEVRAVAGSPVDTPPDPVFKKCRQIPSGNDSYQPFITGPSGTNVSDDGQDTGKPRVSDPMIRPTSSDWMGDGDIRSPNEGCQSPPVCSKNLSPVNLYQPLVTGPSGANMSEDGHETGQPMIRDPLYRPTCSEAKGIRDIRSPHEGYQSTTICSTNFSPDNSYQPLVTGPSGANVSENRHDTGHPRNSTLLTRPTCSEAKDTRDIRSPIEGYQSTPVCKEILSPDNSYQPLVTGPLGANVSKDGNDTGPPLLTRPTCSEAEDTRDIISPNEGYQSITVCNRILSPDNSYQPLVTDPLGANVSKDGNDTDPPLLTRPTCSEAKDIRDIRSPIEGYQSTTVCRKILSPDNSYQPLVTGPLGANVSKDGNDTDPPLLTRPTCSEAKCTRDVRSLNEGYQSLTVCKPNISPDNSYQPAGAVAQR